MQKIVTNIEYSHQIPFKDLDDFDFFTISKDVWLKLNNVEALKIDTRNVAAFNGEAQEERVTKCHIITINISK